MIRYALLAAGAAAVSFAPSAHALTSSAPISEAERDELLNTIRDLQRRVAELERSKQAESAQPAGQVPTPPSPRTPAIAAASPEHATMVANCQAAAGLNAEKISEDPKAWSNACLPAHSKKRWTTYDRVDVDMDLLGSNNGSVVEITPSYTTRWRTRQPDGYRPNHVTLKAGIRAPVDSGNKKAATFADLTKFERASGVAAVFGAEWGNARTQTTKKMKGDINKALGQAQKDCASALITGLERNSFENPDPPQLNSQAEILRRCNRDNLISWITEDDDRRATYYDSIIRPLFGDYTKAKKAAPAYYFVGVEGSFANSTYSFLPLTDPAGTGIPIITELPANFPGGDQQIKRNLYALKGYVGRGTGKHGGIIEAADFSGSLTYRRDFTFPKNTDGQQLCAPHAVRILCYKKNIAPPFELKGFVGGARIASQFVGFSFLPPTAIELKGTYDFELNRYGIEVPVYVIPGDKGAPNGGVQFSCTSSGQTSGGLKLEGDCRAALFLGSDFKIDNR